MGKGDGVREGERERDREGEREGEREGKGFGRGRVHRPSCSPVVVASMTALCAPRSRIPAKIYIPKSVQ